MKSAIAENVKKIIADKCLKQGAVAAKAGYNYKAFSNMLNGRKVITDVDVAKIAKALGVTPNDVFGIRSNVKVPTGILWVTHEKNGKKYLTMIKTNGETVLWERRFLIEHLVDENFEVTDQTLAQENEMFIKSSSTT